MDIRRTRENFVRALEARGIGPATAARLCGTSKDTFERVASGATTKVSADWVRAIADHLPPGDRRRFLDEIFPAPTGRQAAAFEGARWLADDGSILPAPNGLVDEARRRLGTPTGTAMGDVRAFVARAFGWIGLEVLPGGGVWVTLDRARATAAAAKALVDFVEAERPAFARMHDGRMPGATAVRLTAAQLRAAARRVARARITLPADWVDADVPTGALVPELRRLLDSGLSRSVPLRLGEILDGGQACLFAIDRGEAICMHIGSAFDVPTRPWVGERVLDRTEHEAYAAMVDRHAVQAATNAAPTAREVLVSFGDRWTRYQKLLFPFSIDRNPFVLTTSRVLRETPRSGASR